MNENFTSLVFFTVLTQTAVGALAFRWLVLLRGGPDVTTFGFRRITLIIIGLLLILSLAIAFLHLGNPSHAFNAINNIRKSWLSREILSLSLLIGTIFLCLVIVTRNNYMTTDIMISSASILAGIFLIFSMIKLYMIPSVVTWNNPFTPVSFIITTFLCGAILLTLLAERNNTVIFSFVIPLIATLVLSSFINSLIFSGSFSKQSHTLFLIRAVLSLLALLITSAIYFRYNSNKTFMLWVILFVIVISSEIVNRFIFFLSFEKSGL